MIRLIEQDWDHPGGVIGVEIEYDDTPVRDFINFMRTTSAWHENVELVHRKVRWLNNQLREQWNTQKAVDQEVAALAVDLASEDEV